MKVITLYLSIFVLMFACQTNTQTKSNLSDLQQVELSIDLIRRGIQTSDTLALINVLDGMLLSDSSNKSNTTNFTTKIDSIFKQSSSRSNYIGGNSFKNEKIKISNFGDFDINVLSINFESDTAIVDCELILWHVKHSDDSTGEVRLRDTLKFSTKKDRDTIRVSFRWKLFEFSNLLQFLGNYGSGSL